MPQSIGLRTNRRNEMVDITSEIQSAVRECGVTDGLCVAFVAHTTAGITINEGADPSVCDDILGKLSQLVPAGMLTSRAPITMRSPLPSTIIADVDERPSSKVST